MEPRPKQYTRKEKRFFALCACLVLFVGSSAVWWRVINAPLVIAVPPRTMPQPNAFDDYVRAGQAVTRPAPKSPSTSKKPLPLAAKKLLVLQNAAALKELHTGVKRPYLAPADFDNSNIKPGYYNRCGNLARLLLVESQVQAAGGHIDAAVGSCVDVIKMGMDLPRGDSLIGQMMGIALAANAEQELQTLLPNMPAATARTTVMRLGRLYNERATHADVLKWEKEVGHLALARTTTKPGWRKLDSGYPWRDRVKMMTLSPHTMLRNYDAAMDRVIQAAAQPYGTIVPDTNQDLDPLTELWVSSSTGFGFGAAHSESSLLLLTTQCAIRAYEVEHHALPPSLDSLVPGYLKAVPVDPFGRGGPLLYKRTGKSYRLWSVGPDRKDNGGTPIDDSTSPNGPADRYVVRRNRTGDMVAGINH